MWGVNLISGGLLNKELTKYEGKLKKKIFWLQQICLLVKHGKALASAYCMAHTHTHTCSKVLHVSRATQTFAQFEPKSKAFSPLCAVALGYIRSNYLKDCLSAGSDNDNIYQRLLGHVWLAYSEADTSTAHYR